MHDEIKIIMLKKYPGAEWIDIGNYTNPSWIGAYFSIIIYLILYGLLGK